jgi:glutamate-ammonia-ligase adenylyltransferase
MVDRALEGRVLAAVRPAAAEGGWGGDLAAAWPALAPIFAASPYLGGLVRRDPQRLRRALLCEPELRIQALCSQAQALGGEAAGPAAAALRQLKSEVHLLTALADLGGVWDLHEVTGALSRFADAAVHAALRLAAEEAVQAGWQRQVGEGAQGPAPGFFVLAMGKHGAFELNYSSDIDLSLFYDPDALALAPGVEPDFLAARLAERLSKLLQERMPEGYVFRVDLRLRPDPASTPAAVPAAAALAYYETVGQNWERAAFIKARVVAGDLARGEGFLQALRPFIWRRHLDFAAIADIHAIKRQIHIHKVDDRLTARGADLKLGRGGIREIEFYVQTQQLILGGRQESLRSPRTLEALAALAEAGHVSHKAAAALRCAYEALRRWEHRIQMVHDEQMHRLPEADDDRRRVAALSGFGGLARFDSRVATTLRRVNAHYGRLFAGEEPLSSRFGSLVFTGVEDDAETLATLSRMGFSDPARVSGAIRAWHHGRIGATRSERGRELLTRLAPRLLEAAQATGAPDQAFSRFADFFAGLSAGVQVQSLFLAQPRWLALLVRIMALAPRLARVLGRNPAALDALLDPGFFQTFVSPADRPALIAAAGDFEASMNLARRLHRDDSFRIAVQALSGAAPKASLGAAFTDLADGLMQGLARAALTEVERTAGVFPGEIAVIALGKAGSREMNARSDLDLMTLYEPRRPDAVSAGRGLSAETFYARFTQRLIAALSAPTAEGQPYEVDLQLRPSGTKGPVAVSLAAFDSYYADEAETWEMLALTRARVVWASSPSFGERARAHLEDALRAKRDTSADRVAAAEMRQTMARERPASGFWDLKMSPGGLVDIEFCAQFLQLAHAAQGGPLRVNTGETLQALAGAGLAEAKDLRSLHAAWSLQQALVQVLKIAVEDDADPAREPAGLLALLAEAGEARDFAALRRKLTLARTEARAVFERCF